MTTAPTMHLDALLRAASERLAEPFSLAVHIGAGSGAADLYAALPCSRLVLVEGEEAVAEVLRSRCAATLPVAEVEQVVIAPTSGPVTWYQYNLRPLSGTVDALALRSWYPRLEQIGARQMQAVGLASWLASLVFEEQSPDGKSARAASSLLVFDVPGQEAALLEALPDDDLRRFSWIILRHWRFPGSAQLADAARERLARAGFDQILPTVGAVGTADAQIVQELFRFDERREEMRLLSAERDEMRAHASQLERMLAETRQSLREAEEGRQSAESGLHDSRTREAMLSAEVATLTARHQELATANERHVGTAADLQAQATRLEADRAGLQRLCDSLRLSLQEAEAARDRSDEERRSADGRLAALQAREAELSSTIATLEAQQTRLADRAERDANSARDAEARSTQFHAELVELRKGSDALREKLRAAEASVAELGRKYQDAEALARNRLQELDAANKQLGDERKNGRVQAQRIEKLEAELIDAQFRLETLQHELLKAEGQLEVVKDLLLNETTL